MIKRIFHILYVLTLAAVAVYALKPAFDGLVHGSYEPGGMLMATVLTILILGLSGIPVFLVLNIAGLFIDRAHRRRYLAGTAACLAWLAFTFLWMKYGAVP